MNRLLDIIQVIPQRDHTLLLMFENHEQRRFDMKPYLNKKPFSSLRNQAVFMGASVQYGTVVWPGQIDIAPETLWDRSESVQEQEKSAGDVLRKRAQKGAHITFDEAFAEVPDALPLDHDKLLVG